MTAMTTIAKIINNGNQRVVAIPENFHFDTDTVKISQTDKGLLLEPVVEKPKIKGRGDLLLEVLSGFPEDFIQAVEDRDMSPPQEREPL